jgi:hypothetical protein
MTEMNMSMGRIRAPENTVRDMTQPTTRARTVAASTQALPERDSARVATNRGQTTFGPPHTPEKDLA